MRFYISCYFIFLVYLSIGNCAGAAGIITAKKDTTKSDTAKIVLANPLLKLPDSTARITSIATDTVKPAELLNFACTLEGTPYKYGSMDPAKGFDCSGFVNYVFNHFGIVVPRSSSDFTFVQHKIDLKNAKPGDLILFTGTDSAIRRVGHIAIFLSSSADGITFIHSTSGKAHGVTETLLNGYYQGRYMMVIRVFPQNDL
jgi:lipoprotein Spr